MNVIKFLQDSNFDLIVLCITIFLMYDKSYIMIWYKPLRRRKR